MTKTNFQEPKVINIITKAVLDVEDSYFMRSTTWADDFHQIRYFPRVEHSSLPVIVGIPNKCNHYTVKEAISECLEFYDQHNVTPCYVFLCVGELDLIGLSPSFINSKWYEFDSYIWAEMCLFIPKGDMNRPMDPLIALTWFLANYKDKNVLEDNDDPTVRLLNALESKP
ncbi:uncharacterized protein EV154DRAFT_587477 [Mucor mucedo]|uniref:uncharacterized protein n=1 Tax=Mucor mucedo TaxID=29922 RepID=UPI002221066A|nr:uncharacterized protein EV154DRAFT_587477 [Mucor mucedo]KAI7891916.1 hypothetical protein EV154DRAFT_587477 [Mucor mucedo]